MAPPLQLSHYRRGLLGLVLLLGCGFSLLAWRNALKTQAERVHNGFLSRAQTQATVAAQRLQAYKEMVYSLRDSFLGQEHVTRAEFTRVSQSLIARHPGVQALQWVQIVRREERAALEREATQEIGRPFVIRRLTPDLSFQTAPADDEYFVITYVEPVQANHRVLGYDVTSAPTAPILRAARAEREFKVSRTFHLAQSDDRTAPPGVVFILPFWHSELPGNQVAGFVQGVFFVQTMLAQSHQLTTNEALDTYYYDVTDNGPPTLLYANLAGQEPLSLPSAPLMKPPLDDPADVHHTINIGGRRWLMVVRQNAAWTARNYSGQPAAILGAGLAITALLALFLNNLLQRTSRIEEEVAARTRELRATEARLQAILDHSPAIIFVKDLEGRYILFNQPFIEACPAHIRPLHGRTDLDLFPAAEAALYREHDQRVIASGEPAQFEESSTRPDGSFAVSIVQKFPLLDENGKPYALCGIATNITERKAAEQQKLELERKLLEAQKLESLGVLAGGVAHDFNNILTTILGNASLAALDMDPDHHVQQHLRQIENASRRAADLCAQMLAYAGRGSVATVPLDLAALVRDTTALLQVSVGRRARLELQTNDAVPAILGDATQLRQIVMNLVINAADAMNESPDGHVLVRTFVRELPAAFFARAVQSPKRPAGRYVGLEVVDNGCGMPPEVLRRIFEPFYTTKFSGRGLGLAACLGIVNRHEGALFVESAPGRGTSFRLFFPATSAPVVEPSGPSVSPGRSLQGAVLVVDDEEGVRLVASEAFATLGLQSVEAPDGETALRLITHDGRDIRLVLLDLTMPGLSGEETLRRLRPAHPDLRVILMSGYSEGETMQRCANLGVVDFLAKPFDVASLTEKLRRHLG